MPGHCLYHCILMPITITEINNKLLQTDDGAFLVGFSGQISRMLKFKIDLNSIELQHLGLQCEIKIIETKKYQFEWQPDTDQISYRRENILVSLHSSDNMAEIQFAIRAAQQSGKRCYLRVFFINGIKTVMHEFITIIKRNNE